MTMITLSGVVITSYLLCQHTQAKPLVDGSAGSAYSLMMCGCRSTFRYWISRLTRAFISGVVILDRLIIFRAT